ncbi:MAG: hypothetical protein HOP02_04215 [Methylococcaceae bacterium]|nr:hypothetical protein [Methylococcaceae bacterium]
MKNKTLLALCVFATASSNTYSANSILPSPPNELRKIFPFAPPADKEKRSLPIKPFHSKFTDGFYNDRIVLKFNEKHKIRLAKNQFMRLSNEIDSTATKETDSINRLFENIHAKPTRLFIQTEQELDNQKSQGEKLAHKELEDLNSYHLVMLDYLSKQEIENLVDQLNRSNLVEIAYFTSLPSLPVIGAPADIAPTTNNFDAQQTYLDAAPGGINARWAWANRANTRGNGIRLADLEYGWNLDHEDLGFNAADLLSNVNSANDDFRNHGTAVLGEVIGADNAYGVTGIANQVDISMSGDDGNTNNRAAIITNVATNPLRAGDVMLIEQQVFARADQNLTAPACVSQGALLPVENEPAIRASITTATANGIIVVEAAANGGLNLNNVIAQGSNAIMVGAGTSANTHNPLCFSNHGTRVDVQGWGQNVVTTGYGSILNPFTPPTTPVPVNQRYTSTFSGTSSASPIVAATIADINGHFNATFAANGNGNTLGTGRLLNSIVMRSLLRNTGTAQGANNGAGIPATDNLHNIGPLPNIRAALEQGLPIADIRANGSNGPINTNSATNVQVTASIATGGIAGVNADWWVVAQVGSTLYYLNSSLQWTTTQSPISQMDLVNQSNFTLFNGNLSNGSYTLYFGIDTLKNGTLDFGSALFYDTVVVNVN